MDGLSFVTLVEAELKKQGIPKEKFYKESGISSATMSQWRKNIYSPSSAKIKDIEKYLGVSFQIGQKDQRGGLIFDTSILTGFEFNEERFPESAKKPADQKASGLRGLGYDELTPENQKMIADLIDKLLRSQSGEQ